MTPILSPFDHSHGSNWAPPVPFPCLTPPVPVSPAQPRRRSMKPHPRRGYPVPSTVSASHSPPRVHKTAPSTAITTPQALSGHRILYRGCTRSRPRYGLPRLRSHLGAASCTQGAQDCTLGNGCRRPAPSRHPNRRRGRTGLHPRWRLPRRQLHLGTISRIKSV